MAKKQRSDALEIKKEVGINFKYSEMDINRRTIDSFELMENRRILRYNHMKGIKRVILEGKNFDAPIIVNNTGKTKRVIDGQHRITAIKEILQMNPKFSIKVLVVIYNKLSKEKEQEIFGRYNKGMKQSSDDFIQMYADDIPVYKMLQDKGVEMSIYKQRDKIHFKALLEAYLSFERKAMSGMKKEDLIKKSMALGKEDADKLEEFIRGYQDNIIPIGNSDLQKTTPFEAILIAYFKTDIPKKEYWKKIIPILNTDKFLLFTRMGGHSATTVAVETIMDIMTRTGEDNEREDQIF